MTTRHFRTNRKNCRKRIEEWSTWFEVWGFRGTLLLDAAAAATAVTAWNYGVKNENKELY